MDLALPPAGGLAALCCRPAPRQALGALAGYSGIVKEDCFKGLESSDQSIKAAKVINPDAQDEIWPNFTFTQDESDQLDSLASDIEKYVDEATDKFINGDLPMSDWDKYVNKIKKMGLDDYMEIQQSAYDRYRKA